MRLQMLLNDILIGIFIVSMTYLIVDLFVNHGALIDALFRELP